MKTIFLIDVVQCFPLVYTFDREEDAFAVILKFGLDHAKQLKK